MMRWSRGYRPSPPPALAVSSRFRARLLPWRSRMGNPSDTVRLLRRLEDGDDGAADELLPRLYRELHGIARKLMSDERGSHWLRSIAHAATLPDS